MRKLTALLLILSLILCGCTLGRDNLKEPVTFYYLRSHAQQDAYDAFFEEGAIGSEVREAAGHRQDLHYLISMYLRGPVEESLEACLPAGTALTEISRSEDLLIIRLQIPSADLSEMDITVAFSCLARTCLELIQIETVQIEAADTASVIHSRTFQGSDLLLTDTLTPSAEAEP